MSQLKNYTGSVYGGLGHLLKAYCEAKGLEIPGQLQQVQNLERFDYVIWRDLLEDLKRLHPRTGLGLEIALLLCYSEQSAFQRAFKLWTGLTPQQWRKNNTIYSS